MKHYLSFLGEMHQTLRRRSSYSTVRACVASLVFVLLAINCGPPPPGQYAVPESAMQAAERATTPKSAEGQASLPESAAVRLQEQPYLRNAFKEPVTASRSGLDDFFAKTRGTVQHAAVISGGSLDVLKAFVAKGWAPIVMIQFQGRTPEILPLSDYNDQLSEVYLQNPTNLSKRRLTYGDFETAWSKHSQNKCVLITPQKLTETDLQNALGRAIYPQKPSNKLPSEAANVTFHQSD